MLGELGSVRHGWGAWLGSEPVAELKGGPASQVARETAHRSAAAHARLRLPTSADHAAKDGSHWVSSGGASKSSASGHARRQGFVVSDGRGLPPDDGYHNRQKAGLALLIEIASHTSLGMANTGATILPSIPDHRREELLGEPADVIDGGSAANGRFGRIGWLRSKLRGDHLVRNSLYLMVSSVIQAVLGFSFWILMARLFSAQDVGRASSLISATSLIAYFSLVGLNTTLMRFLPTSKVKGPLLTAAFVMVLGSGSVIGLVYALLTPELAPRLDFVAHSPLMTAGFVLLTAATGVNLLTDSVFIASRRATLCAVTDGLVGGFSKIAFGILLVGTGAYGLYSASVAGSAAAAIVSIVLIITSLRWRPSLRNPLRVLKPLLRFSGVNYVANALNMLPGVVVPLIVLDRLGAGPAGYYFVAFQIASLLYAAVNAVEASFMAEGSHADANWRRLRRRSRRLAVVLFAPGAIVLALGAHWILLVFGGGYSQHAAESLAELAVSVLPIAVCNWSWTVLRLAGRLGALVVSSVVYAGAICATAWVFAPHGLTALSSAWLVGSGLAAAVAGVASAQTRAKARHRRTRRPAPAPTVAQPPGQVTGSLSSR